MHIHKKILNPTHSHHMGGRLQYVFWCFECIEMRLMEFSCLSLFLAVKLEIAGWLRRLVENMVILGQAWNFYII